jgi:hypothetical protein
MTNNSSMRRDYFKKIIKVEIVAEFACFYIKKILSIGNYCFKERINKLKDD